ncbi:MAG TPA: hypothetical protein VJO33_08130 [Gemmatimonadaceae bacterium]|nr:hypothetical protein [Gemmatimonadaceae bacterium]
MSRSLNCGKLAVAVALLFILGARAVAQTDINPSPTVINPSPPGYKEYIAILGTPLGSLPPLTTYTLSGLAQRTPEIVARYGFVSDMALPLAPDSGGHHAHSLSAFGLTGLFPLDLGGTVSLTLGVANQTCTGCTGARFMGSVAFDSRILSTALDDAGNGSRFSLAVNGEVGAGNPATGTAWTAAVGFPLSLTVGPQSGTQLIPFMTPGVTFVTTSGSNEANEIHSLRAITGGGVALFNAKSNLGASAGIQYIFVPKTQVLIGVSLSWGGR